MVAPIETFPGAFDGAANWLITTLAGPLATALAVIAVALFGMRMLGGELALRRGAMVVLGLFLIFGASAIARSLIAVAGPGTEPVSPASATIEVPPPAIPSQVPTFDPYAGASVPH